MASALHQARSALRHRLEARRTEIEQALLARIYGIADPTEVGDLTYVEGLRTAAAAAVDWAFATLESPDDRRRLVPPALLSQARLAARNRVDLGTVLRRYTAGHALLVDFLIEEVEREDAVPPTELRRILAASSSSFDRLLAAVDEEYARELESRPDFSQERRHAERIERLLAGEPTDVSDLPYDFGGWHLAVVAQGSGAEEQIRAISATFDCGILVIPQGDSVIWAWLGSREPLDLAQVVAADLDPEVAVVFGEPGEGLHGWRLSHRQAIAALPIALRSPEPMVRYADVALTAAVLENDLLLTTLRRLYLDPLADERDGGLILRETLRAYMTAERNISSAAAALKVSRRTVANRLQTIEARIGRPLGPSMLDIEAALRLEELTAPTG